MHVLVLGRHALAVLVAALAMVLTGLTGVAHAVEEPTPAPEPEPTEITNVSRPAIRGLLRYKEPPVVADPGEWSPEDVTLGYQWYVGGVPVPDATGTEFRPQLEDIGKKLVLEVTATREGLEPVTALSSERKIRKGLLDIVERPRIDGKRRYDHTLTATPGVWERTPDRVRYQWFRGDDRITGATGRRHHLGLADFGERMLVMVTVRKEGFVPASWTSTRTRPVMHRVPARHTVTYHVETRGHITADLGVFRRQAQQTFDDPRGWRGAGVAFRRVRSGGDFTLVLSEASHVPGFSSGCSSEWSCRVGRYVIINQMRWLNASPMWREAGRSTRDYRHMVVNHETGHWLGHGHRTCPSSGALAPVMQQQSKGLAGCRPNPWPTARERSMPRFS